nr:Hpt domain-containing protein [uncultured Roseateles sp.]
MTVIDRQIYAELQETAGAEFVTELVQAFLEDAPVQLRALARAAEAGDALALRRAAHTLKSNGNTFGAIAFADLARALEQDVNPGPEALAAQLQALEAAYAEAATALTGLSHA